MAEKRKHKRMRPIYYLKAVHMKSQSLAGGVIDITTGGLRLSGTEAYEKNSIASFVLPLPDAVRGEMMITVKARNVWCQHDSASDFYDYYSSGFCLEDISIDDAEIITNSLKSYLFEG